MSHPDHDSSHAIKLMPDSNSIVDISRRSFAGLFIGTAGALIAAIVGTPLLRFLLSPVYARTTSGHSADLGNLAQFADAKGPVATTLNYTESDGWREVVTSRPVFVCRGADGAMQVLSATCPHLGCTVAWHPAQQQYVCPCHGGQFSQSGERIAGPPPKGLECLNSTVKDGRLHVQLAANCTADRNEGSLS